MRIVTLSFGVSLFRRLVDSLFPRIAFEVSVGVGEGIGAKGWLRLRCNLDSACSITALVVGQRRCHALIEHYVSVLPHSYPWDPDAVYAIILASQQTHSLSLTG